MKQAKKLRGRMAIRDLVGWIKWAILVFMLVGGCAVDVAPVVEPEGCYESWHAEVTCTRDPDVCTLTPGPASCHYKRSEACLDDFVTPPQPPGCADILTSCPKIAEILDGGGDIFERAITGCVIDSRLW